MKKLKPLAFSGRFRTARRAATPAWIAVLLAILVASTPAAGRAPDLCDLSDAQLEESGAVVGRILIDNANIFDLDDPEEDVALFRLLNRLHIRTRPAIIRRQLLFETGEPFQRRLLEETERILRATAYLYNAEITLLSCADGVVDIAVQTRDVWTLKPGVSVSRSGGESRTSFDIQDDNFLGRGSSIHLARKYDEERQSTLFGYTDRNLGGRWITLDTSIEDNSDGNVFALRLERPFYALDTRWATGSAWRAEKSRDSIYSLGDEVGEFGQDIESFYLYGGWSRGIRDGWVERWRLGVAYDKRRFDNTNGILDPDLVPADRKLLYPYLGYERIEDRFLRAEDLDQIHRTEDFQLGARLSLRLGLLSKTLGSDRQGAIFAASASRGYGDPARRVLLLSSYAQGRIESGELANAVLGGSLRWYQRQSGRRLLYLALHGDVAENLDLDNPLEIGGDEGLRGYPLRYQRGDARARFTLEQRYFTDYYLWRLFRVGGAVFFDAGRVWGRNPYGGENLGLLRDVGFGLRLSSTRSSIAKMIHIDFAFPLDGDDSIDSFQFLVEGKRSF